MMIISSSSSSSCFDYASDFLECFYEMNGYHYSPIRELKIGIRLLETFDLFIRKCRRRRSNQGTHLEYDKEDKGDAKFDSLKLSSVSFKIQDLVWGSIDGLDSIRFKYMQYGASHCSEIICELERFEENIRLLVETDIKELDISSLLLKYSLGDLQVLMDFIDSILVNLARICDKKVASINTALKTVLETLREKLMFLHSFLCFATVQGVDGQPLTDLLAHIEIVAVNVANLASTLWFQRCNMKVCNVTKFEISQLIHKMIVPIDPQVREIYTHVLEASKLSRSSYTLALKENRHLVAEFIDYLEQSILVIVSECYTSFLVTVKDQMIKLLKGVRFLSILLRLQQEKFDKLNDEMKDLIGVVVSDAGSVAFSLFVNKMKEGMSRDTDPALSNLVQVLKLIIVEAALVYQLTPLSSSFSFARINELGSFDFLLETLKELVSSTVDSIAFPNDQIRAILEDLVFLRSFLGNIVEQRTRDEKLQALWSRVMKVAYSAELEIDCALLVDKRLDGIAADIHLMRTEAEVIYGSIRYDGETQTITKTTINMPSQVTAPISNEALVGLNDEVKSIINRLVRGSRQLDIVAIVGMPGLGKTTIANEVYGHPSVDCHFHIRAWCCISQVYTKHSLLVQILCSIDGRSSNQYLEKKEDDMAEELRKLLKRNRYLIILDDVWDIVGWDLLKDSLPDDCNASRILLTSRFHKLSLQIKCESEPLHLRPLTVDESLELLQNKLFAKEGCPSTLSEVVQHVAKCCKGLPLVIVLVAGMLAATKKDCWEEVAGRLSSTIFVDTDHCMNTVEQSYNYLPDYLKPCLLYIGAFQEDRDIPVREMLWLWISEGFVQKTEGKSLEDVADEYLMDLIGRSLVMATQQRSLGGIKACRIHDLIREFCMVKAKEESFLQNLHVDDLFTFTGPYNPHRLSIHPTPTMERIESRLSFPNLRCLLFLGNSYAQLDENSSKILLSKLLRVLYLWNGPSLTSYFPREVIFLVHLRYLRIGGFSGDIPSAIANLSRLETFVAVGIMGENISLPNTIWNIKTLRHLVRLGCGFRFPIYNLAGSLDLKHLDTLTLEIDFPSQNLQKLLSKFPSIRRLTIITESERALVSARYQYCNRILVLNYLSGLESLKISSFYKYEFQFPLNLKKLTLWHNRQPWSKISAIGKLPNLEVLKLCHDSFVGEKWEMKEGEFHNLRVLKLLGLDIRWWTASSGNFFCLEKLVLEDCRKLEEVPSCLGESLTLDMIEVKRCHESAVNSVEQILQEQREWGNEGLNSIIIEQGSWYGP